MSDIAIVVLRLLAIYLATGVIGTLSLFVALFAQNAQTTLMAAPAVNLALLVVSSIGLWAFAPAIGNVIAKGTTNTSHISSDTANGICIAIIVATGLLIFSQSFAFFSQASGTHIAVALAYTGLAAVMIFMPRIILRGAYALEGLKK